MEKRWYENQVMKGRKTAIEYVCSCGEGWEIGDLYWSVPCRKIVCSTPSCSMEEIESYYCPFLLENMSSQEAMLYKNRSSECFICPECESVLHTMAKDDQQCFFCCAYCRWDSLAINLVEKTPDLLKMAALALERESPELQIGQQLLQHFQNVLHLQPGVNYPTRKKTRVSEKQGNASLLQRWSWEDAEKQRCENERLPDLTAGNREMYHKWVEMKTSNSSLDVNQIESLGNISSLKQRLEFPLEQQQLLRHSRPSRLPLRTKRVRRCLDALQKGLPGILVKPQINPLTGDSSMHTTTSWFKKADLAIHYLPNFVLLKDPRSISDSLLEWEVLVINPLDEPINLTLVQDPDASSPQMNIPGTPIRIKEAEDPALLNAFDEAPGDANSGSAPASADLQDFVVDQTYNTVTLRFQAETQEVPRDLKLGLTVLVERDGQEQHGRSTVEFRVEFNLGPTYNS